MFSLEFLSFGYRCSLLWNDYSVAGSYDPPSFFFISIKNWHIKILSSSAGISSSFLASPNLRNKLFQTFRSYSLFFTVFSGRCVKMYFCKLAIVNWPFSWFSFCCEPMFSLSLNFLPHQGNKTLSRYGLSPCRKLIFALVLFLIWNIFKKADLGGGVVRKWKKNPRKVGTIWENVALFSVKLLL